MRRLRPWIPHLLWLYALIACSMLVGWSVNHINLGGRNVPPGLSAAILRFASIPGYAYFALQLLGEHRVADDSHYGTGFQYHVPKEQLPNASLLIPTFDREGLLVTEWRGMRDGALRYRWTLPESFVSGKQAYVDMAITMGHPVLLSDTSLIFVSGILCRLDKLGQVQWVNNRYHFHHALELDADSVLWTSVRIDGNPYYHFGGDTLVNEGIAAVDIHNGKELLVRSAAEILVRNGYRWLLEVGPFEPDLLHLNDVEPALQDSPYWKKGDVLVSVRNRNTVFLYRPSIDSILWLQTGPWLNQHDADFVGDSTVMVYGNDVIRGRKEHLLYGHNDIYLYHFGTRTISKPYSRMMDSLRIDTPTQGRCDLLPNGDLLVDETDHGVVYILTPDALKAIYTERYDEKRLKQFGWVRPIPH